MKLVSVWIKATRPHEERLRVESIYKNEILDSFEGVENAKRAFDLYKSNPHKLFQDWPYAHYNAFRKVSREFSAWERVNTSFKNTFI